VGAVLPSEIATGPAWPSLGVAVTWRDSSTQTLAVKGCPEAMRPAGTLTLSEYCGL